MTVLPLQMTEGGRRMVDPELVELVDALVEAVDTDRTNAVDRVQAALGPWGVSTLFASEVRRYGISSSAEFWNHWTDHEGEQP